MFVNVPFITALLAIVFSLQVAPFCFAEPLQASGNVMLSGQRLEGITGGRTITLNNMTVTGDITAGRAIIAEQSRLNGNLSAGRDVRLKNCTGIQTLSVGRSLWLDHVNVAGDVSAGGEVQLSHTTVKGTLSVSTPEMTLQDSTVNSIHFQAPESGVLKGDNNVMIRNQGIYIGKGRSATRDNNDTDSLPGYSSRVVSQNGQTTVMVGENGTVNLQGYLVKGFPQQPGEPTPKTILTTPEGLVFINGKREGAQDPKDYEAYCQSHPGAPQIMGPGWPATSTVAVDAKSVEEPAAQQPVEIPAFVLTLTENSVVTGNVVFKGGKGLVQVYPGASIQGQVSGGTVQYLN